MQIQVHTDNNISGSPELNALVEGVVGGVVSRYGDRVTRVSAYFTDENSDKKIGADDKRCVLEVRLAGLQPISVRDFGATIQQALDGAADKLTNALERQLGRLDGKRGRTSFSGDDLTAEAETSLGDETD